MNELLFNQLRTFDVFFEQERSIDMKIFELLEEDKCLSYFENK